MLVGRAHGHGHQHLEDEVVGREVAPPQEASERERHGRQHRVVDGAAEPVLDPLEEVQGRVHPAVTPVGADRDVERRRRRPAHTGPGHRARRGELRRGAPDHGPRRAAERADDADALRRRGRALHERLGEELHPRRLRPRDPAGGGGPDRHRVGRRGEEDRRDVHAGDPVDECVMGLGHHREARRAVGRRGETLDEVDLPERLVPVERDGEDAAAERGELLVGARGRQRGVPHVVAEVEVRVVDPDRPALVERDPCELLPVARHEVQALVQRGLHVLVRGRFALEDHDRGDVHVRLAGLDVEEGRVERGEAVGVGHPGESPAFAHLETTFNTEPCKPTTACVGFRSTPTPPR